MSIVGVELEGAWSFTEDQRLAYVQQSRRMIRLWKRCPKGVRGGWMALQETEFMKVSTCLEDLRILTIRPQAFALIDL